MRARSKRSIYIRKQVELNQVGIHCIILLKVKRVCRLDQNTVTMALRRVLFAILIHVDSRILRLLAINNEHTFKVSLYMYSC